PVHVESENPSSIALSIVIDDADNREATRGIDIGDAIASNVNPGVRIGLAGQRGHTDRNSKVGVYQSIETVCCCGLPRPVVVCDLKERRISNICLPEPSVLTANAK